MTHKFVSETSSIMSNDYQLFFKLHIFKQKFLQILTMLN